MCSLSCRLFALKKNLHLHCILNKYFINVLGTSILLKRQKRMFKLIFCLCHSRRKMKMTCWSLVDNLLQIQIWDSIKLALSNLYLFQIGKSAVFTCASTSLAAATRWHWLHQQSKKCTLVSLLSQSHACQWCGPSLARCPVQCLLGREPFTPLPMGD